MSFCLAKNHATLVVWAFSIKTILKDNTEEKESSNDKKVLSIEDRLKRLGLSKSQDNGL